MEKQIQEALKKKKINKQQAEKIQKNIDDVNFVSPLGREQAIKESIKWCIRGNKKLQEALREDKRKQGLLKLKGYYRNKRIEKQLQEVHIPSFLEIANLPIFNKTKFLPSLKAWVSLR